MSNLPNSVIRLVPPTLRGGYCPDSWTEFARTIVGGTSAQVNLDRGHTFYNFGNVPVFPTPEPPAPSCVDFGIDWEPAAFEMEKYISAYVGGEFPSLNGATSLSFEATEYSRNSGTFDYFFIWDNTTIETISFPNMVTLATGITIRNLSALTSLLMPQLTTVVDVNVGNINCRFCTNLVTVDMSSLVDLGDNLAFEGCSSLASFNAPNMIPKNNKTLDFSDCALDQASVDHILARCVANPLFKDGSILLDGGTNSAPSASGLADKATLLARGGALLITNN